MNASYNPYPHHQYTILGQISDAYADIDMSDILLVSCQHLLAPQLALFSNLFGAGLKPENCLIVGKNYSTNTEVLSELRRARCPISPVSDQFDPLRCFDTWFAPRVTAWVADIISERNMNKIRRIIVLDDGGYMHESMHRLYGNHTHIAGVEQTSSGKTRIERLGIKFNEHMVASSMYKQRDEARFIGALGAQRIVAHIHSRGIESPRVLVLGMGTIGRNTALQLYLMHGLEVDVTDIRYDDRAASDLRSSKAHMMFESRGLRKEYTDAMRDIAGYDIIVGATGSRALSARQIQCDIHPHASLISMSSGDTEFDSVSFRSSHHRVHDICMMGDRCLVNTGFPITFSGQFHEIHPLQIELTIAQLQASVMDLAREDHSTSSRSYYNKVIDDAYITWREELIEQEFVVV